MQYKQLSSGELVPAEGEYRWEVKVTVDSVNQSLSFAPAGIDYNAHTAMPGWFPFHAQASDSGDTYVFWRRARIAAMPRPPVDND